MRSCPPVARIVTARRKSSCGSNIYRDTGYGTGPGTYFGREFLTSGEYGCRAIHRWNPHAVRFRAMYGSTYLVPRPTARNQRWLRAIHGEDGQPRDDGKYNMRSIKRVYQVAPFSTETRARCVPPKSGRCMISPFSGPMALRPAGTCTAAEVCPTWRLTSCLFFFKKKLSYSPSKHQCINTPTRIVPTRKCLCRRNGRSCVFGKFAKL